MISSEKLEPSNPPASVCPATFNMRGGASVGHWEQFLNRTQPDIAFVQETKDPAAPGGDLLLGPNLDRALWSPVDHGLWGTAVLLQAGEPVDVAVAGFTGWVTGARTSLFRQRVDVFSVHVPAGVSYVHQTHAILDAIQDVRDSDVIVIAGDFNVTVGRRRPEGDLEQRAGERALLSRFQEDFGLVSAWDVANPGVPLPQTLRWTGNQETPYHCDGLFIPRVWCDRIVECDVMDGPPWPGLSDHNRYLSELRQGNYAPSASFEHDLT